MDECLWIYIHTKGIFVNSFFTQHFWSATAEEIYLFVFINFFSFQLVNLSVFTCVLKLIHCNHYRNVISIWTFSFSCVFACSLVFFLYFFFAIMETQNKFVGNFYCSRFHNASQRVMSIGIFTLYSIPLIIV